jgi:thiamine pyrophosphate-dependent acetolactate synthase large subunit-like protein
LLDAQLAVAPDARDAFDNAHPRFVGVVGAMGHASATVALSLARSVLLVGTRLPLLARQGLESCRRRQAGAVGGSGAPVRRVRGRASGARET